MKAVLSAVTLALTFVFVGDSKAEEPPAAPQLHKPSECLEGNKKCILDWYAEYKAGLLEEFMAYRELEGPLSGAIENRSDLAAASLAGELHRRKLYKHNHWASAEIDQVNDAGIDYKDFDALVSDCRVAIIDLKFMIIAASSAKFDQAMRDRPDYLKVATACEKRFRLSKFDSFLR